MIRVIDLRMWFNAGKDKVVGPNNHHRAACKGDWGDEGYSRDSNSHHRATVRRVRVTGVRRVIR